MNMKSCAREILDLRYSLGRANSTKRRARAQNMTERHDAAMERFKTFNPSPLVMQRLIHAAQINENLGFYENSRFPVDLFQATEDAEKSLFKVIT